MLLLLSIGSIILSDLAGATSPSRWQGRSTNAVTPFDLKVIGSGFYQIHGGGQTTARQSVEQIFAEAATFQYRRDNNEDDWQHPQLTEQQKSGDCEDMALWVYKKLRQNGYSKVRIMVGKFESADPKFHTWAVCAAPNGDDYIIDPALQTRIWKRSDLLPEVYLPQFSFDGQNKYAH